MVQLRNAPAAQQGESEPINPVGKLASRFEPKKLGSDGSVAGAASAAPTKPLGAVAAASSKFGGVAPRAPDNRGPSEVIKSTPAQKGNEIAAPFGKLQLAKVGEKSQPVQGANVSLLLFAHRVKTSINNTGNYKKNTDTTHRSEIVTERLSCAGCKGTNDYAFLERKRKQKCTISSCTISCSGRCKSLIVEDTKCSAEGSTSGRRTSSIKCTSVETKTRREGKNLNAGSYKFP